MTPIIKKIVLMGSFIGLGVSLGYLLQPIPNVEMVTATTFIGGYLLGIRQGLLIGITTELIFSTLNPLGSASPPLIAAMAISMGISGAWGGILGMKSNHNGRGFRIKLAFAASVCTIIFYVFTTVSFAILLSLSFEQLINSFAAGTIFLIIHITSNIFIFTIIVPVIIKRLEKTGLFSSTSIGINSL